MSVLCAYGCCHLLILLFMTYQEYKIEDNAYGLLTQMVSKKGLHLCHSAFILFLIYVLSKTLVYVLLGRLRSDEIAVLNENCIYYLADIILVVSLFSDDISSQNFLIFSKIVSLKCLLWIFEQRILTQRDMRVAIYGVYILVLSQAFFVFTILSAVMKPSIHILFAFEFSLLFLGSLKTLLRMYIENTYADKQKVYANFGLDIFFIVLRLKVTMVLFVWTTFTLRIPFNIIRDIFKIISQLGMTIRNYSGVKRVYDNLDRCESVSEGTCPICREEMESGKKILCGHAFHTNCLKQWAEKQQVCPICRHVMFSDDIVQLGDENEFITGIPVEYIQ